MRTTLFIGCLLCAGWPCLAQQGFTFRENQQKKKVEVLYNNKLVTAYCYWDSTEKPVLYPIRTLSGVTITRGYPVAPRAGERTDHPHQVGLWLNYESVNGFDFWNNSFAITSDKKPSYGSIRHQKFLAMGEKGSGILRAISNWIDSKNNVILEEMTEFKFQIRHGDLVIDRTSVLKAKQESVVFKDVKDGLLGLRVARELEMPSQQADTFVDANGVATKVPAMNNAGVTGQYVNHEGITGDATWGKRSVWTCLNGQRGGEHISIAIIDHPENPGSPTFWHARGYGLFAANPLGRKIFTDGKEEMNFTMTKDQTTKFRFRIVIHAGPSYLGADDINSLTTEFQNSSVR
jgi:hypothetical protein